MELLFLSVVFIILFTGLVATFFSLFGTLIIFLCSVTIAVGYNFSIITLPQIIFLGILYVTGEILEFTITYYGSRKMGATKASALTAVLGAILGAILGTSIPGLGTLIGSLIGLFAGAFLMELIIKKDVIDSLKAGTGSILGRTLAIGIKFVIALVMCGVIIASII